MKKIVGSTLSLIGLWLGFAVVSMLAEFWMFVGVPDAMQESGWARGLAIAVNQLPALLAVWLVACKMEGRTMADIGVKKRRWWLWLPFGAVAACLFYALYFYLAFCRGDLTWPAPNAGWSGNLLFYLGGYFLVALGEEWMCRGYLQDLFYREMGRTASLLLPSAVFMILHLGSYGRRYTAYIGAFALGVLLAVMAWVTGSVWMSVGFHWLYNWMEAAFFGIEGERFSVYVTDIQNVGHWDFLPALLAFICAGTVSLLYVCYQKKGSFGKVNTKEDHRG